MFFHKSIIADSGEIILMLDFISKAELILMDNYCPEPTLLPVTGDWADAEGAINIFDVLYIFCKNMRTLVMYFGILQKSPLSAIARRET